MNTVKKQILTLLTIIGLSAPIYAAQSPIVFAEGMPEHTQVGMFSNKISDLLRSHPQGDSTELCGKYAVEFENEAYKALITKFEKQRVRFPGSGPNEFSICKTILMVILQNVVGAFATVAKDSQGEKTQKSYTYVISEEYCTNIMEQQLKPNTPETFREALGDDAAQNKFWQKFANLMHKTCSKIQTVSTSASSIVEVIGQVPSSEDEQFIAYIVQEVTTKMEKALQEQRKDMEKALQEQSKARTKRQHTCIRHAFCTALVGFAEYCNFSVPGPQAPLIESASGLVVMSIGALVLNKILKKTVIR
jgi:hypothetical protein